VSTVAEGVAEGVNSGMKTKVGSSDGVGGSVTGGAGAGGEGAPSSAQKLFTPSAGPLHGVTVQQPSHPSPHVYHI
jgi:hypothetical protein